MAQEIEIVLSEELQKTYIRLPPAIRKKFDKQLRFLARDPRHPSLKIHRLNGDWEFYVDVHYRCFFQREGNRYYIVRSGKIRMASYSADGREFVKMRRSASAR